MGRNEATVFPPAVSLWTNHTKIPHSYSAFGGQVIFDNFDFVLQVKGIA